MYKNIYTTAFLAASAMILAATSCSSDEPAGGMAKDGAKIQVIATGFIGDDDTDTRTLRPENENGLGFAWKTGDVLYVTNQSGVSLGTLTLDPSDNGKAEGSFTGSMSVTDGQVLNIFYLGSKTTNFSSIGRTFADDLSVQDGGFDALPEKDFMACTATVKVEDNVAKVNFIVNSRLSFAHFTLDGGSGVSFNNATVTVSGENLSNKATFSLSDAEAAMSLEAGGITATAHGNDLYIVLPPAQDVALTFTAKVGSATYTGTIPAREYKANRYFAIGMGQGKTVTMEEESAGEWVDLDLPSGTLWASKNIGAAAPQNSGSYYGWGDVTGTKIVNSASQFGPSSYDGASSSYENTFGTLYYYQCCATDNRYSSYNIAAYQLGNKWTMPTPAQVEELYTNTDYVRTTLDGVNGYRFTSKTDSSKWIFIPSAGYRSMNDGSVKSNGYMYVWTSEIHWYMDEVLGGYGYNYTKRGIALSDYWSRGEKLQYGVMEPQYGFPVRPVRK